MPDSPPFDLAKAKKISMKFEADKYHQSIGDLAEVAFQLPGALQEIASLKSDLDRAIKVLNYAESLQPAAIATIKKHGFVFNTDLSDVVEHPEGEKTIREWEKLAFGLYVDLCDLNSRVRRFKEDHVQA
jgi:hypothetical protein